MSNTLVEITGTKITAEYVELTASAIEEVLMAEDLFETYEVPQVRFSFDRNNLRKITFHDIRHSFGSVIFNSTGDIKVVSDLLGHSNISTTSDIYVKTNEAHKKEALENLGNGKD